jgi:hypothetical protein
MNGWMNEWMDGWMDGWKQVAPICIMVLPIIMASSNQCSSSYLEMVPKEPRQFLKDNYINYASQNKKHSKNQF